MFHVFEFEDSGFRSRGVLFHLFHGSTSLSRLVSERR
jgi:hypothetical protein